MSFIDWIDKLDFSVSESETAVEKVNKGSQDFVSLNYIGLIFYSGSQAPFVSFLFCLFILNLQVTITFYLSLNISNH